MRKADGDDAGWREPFPHLTPAWRAALVRRLRGWYRRARRDLPWRRTPNPYRVWISEVMLQQTQVATVVPYYRRFLRAFPTVRALAAADEADVLRFWEGLGYYRRARQLHAAAREMVARFGGRLPNTLQDLQGLPGIGRYTAGAILSIGWQQPAPIVEANSQRLYCRLLAWESDPRSAASQALLWKFAAWVLPTTEPGDFNQALMELGSLVCTPQQPNCAACPLQALCPCRALGATARIPRVAQRVTATRLRQAAVLVQRGDRWLLRQYAANERWAGLWDLPRFDFPEGSQLTLLAATLAEQTGLQVALEPTDWRIRHQVTRFQIELQAVRAVAVSGTLQAAKGTLRWFRTSELARVPLHVTGRKLVRHFSQPAGTTLPAPQETPPAVERPGRRSRPADRRAKKR